MPEEGTSGPERPSIKLFSKGKIVLLTICLLTGSFFNSADELLSKRDLSFQTLMSSVISFLLGLGLLSLIVWYANKPERK